MFRLNLTFALILCSFLAFAQKKNVLDRIIGQSQLLQEITTQNEKYQAQIIYTQINRNRKNKPSFTSYTFGINDSLYFYPASTVKMPAAFLSLQKLNELKVKDLNKNTALRIGADRFPQTAVRTDTSSATGLPSIAHYIKKIFVVSDNDAFNRLYEFLGQNYINKQLWQRDFKNSRITHRLVGGYDGEENRFTNPFWFYNDSMVIYEQPSQTGSLEFSRFSSLKRNVRGKGFLTNDGKLVNKPFDFSNKNFISLTNLHSMLKAVMFPESLPEKQRFNLTQEDYTFLYEWMSKLPKDSNSQAYDHPDNYVKFFIYGSKPDDFQIPDQIRIFNKVGFAYGFLTDVAYIADIETGVEFMLAATIHVSANEIYNDGRYEYNSVGIPFLAELGKRIYDFECNRKRKHRPDLSKFFEK